MQMYSIQRWQAYLVILPVLLLLLSGCDNPQKTSLFDEDYESPRPEPVINEIDPEDGHLAGIDGLTLLGSNFVPGETFVYFNDRRATILDHDGDILKLRTPQITGDSLRVRASVLGNDKFSNTILYKLDPAVMPREGIRDTDEPWGITTDSDGNLYMSFRESGTESGVLKVSPDGTRESFVDPRPWVYATLKFGPDGSLYMTRSGRAVIYRAPPEGGADAPWVGGLGRVQDIDFDKNGYIWGGGDNKNTNDNDIFRVDHVNGDTEKYEFNADIFAVRVYEDHLYVGGSKDGTLGVWRFNIESSTLGSEELYYNVSDNFPDKTALYALDFSDDGNMLVGTNGEDPLIRVDQERNGSLFYPGLLSSTSYRFAWIEGTTNMLITRANLHQNDSQGTIIEVNTLMEGAPYLGTN